MSKTKQMLHNSEGCDVTHKVLGNVVKLGVQPLREYCQTPINLIQSLTCHDKIVYVAHHHSNRLFRMEICDLCFAGAVTANPFPPCLSNTDHIVHKQLATNGKGSVYFRGTVCWLRRASFGWSNNPSMIKLLFLDTLRLILDTRYHH